MNSDEAQRCIDLGKIAMKQGDIEKAQRLFQKSLKLYPTAEAENLLQQASKMQSAPQHHHHHHNSAPSPSPSSPAFSPEQEKMCQDLLRKTNYYDILGLSKSATQNEIKKAYRSLALKLHPDKNQAPSSSEAFKKINKAFACLSDEVKRKTYDQTGQETVPGLEMNPNFNFGDADFADHVFREFFGESFFFPQNGFHRVYRTHNFERRSEPRPQANARAPLMQFLPIIILLLFSIGSSFFSSPDLYSFKMSSTYSLKRVTENFGVEYFIEPSYAKSLSVNEKARVEKLVERDYMYILEQNCEMQKRKRNQLIQKANYYKGNTGQQYRDYADSMDMSSCSDYARMKRG